MNRSSWSGTSKLSKRLVTYSLLLLACPIVYLLSIGPVLAIGFWLREATGWDGFYSVLYVYYPILAWGRFEPVMSYIGWWCDLLGTVGPG